MINNTHEELIQLPNGSRAFITGVKDTCEHDWSDVFYSTVSGKGIFWNTFTNWASYTNEYRGKLIYDYQEKVDDPITEMMPCCRKCKKVYNPLNDPSMWAI